MKLAMKQSCGASARLGLVSACLLCILGGPLSLEAAYSGAFVTVSPAAFVGGQAANGSVQVQNTGDSDDMIIEADSWPAGWSVSPKNVNPHITAGSYYTAGFTVTPPAAGGAGTILWKLYYDGLGPHPIGSVLLDTTNQSVSASPSFAPHFTDARITNKVDLDGDTYARQFTVEFDVDSQVAGSCYVKLYEYDGGYLVDDYLTNSPVFALSGTNTGCQAVTIVCDDYPGIDLFGHSTDEIKLEIYNAANNQLVQTWTPSNDPDLGNLNVELSNEDMAVIAAYWLPPLDVSAGDVVNLCAEVSGIPVGAQCTLQVFEDDGPLLPDDPLLPTLTGTVVAAEEGKTYVKSTWTAQWVADQWGDPEYYFKLTYSDLTFSSSRDTEGELIVRNNRQQPCTAHGDFYYDPGPAVGEATQKVPLTDDRVPIILVHGRTGDTKIDSLNYWYAWANADTSQEGSQLGRFNETDMKNHFRVYRYVYDSRRGIAENGAALASFVNQFCQTNVAFSERQVVVLAHSMGGVVARYALNIDSTFRDRVHRLLTLGAPHLGTPGANPTWLLWAYPGTLGPAVAVFNETLMQDNTQGYFDLAWYNVNEIPVAARSIPTLFLYHELYNDTWLDNSLTAPFCNGTDMTREDGDAKVVAFGGYATGPISTGTGSTWPEGVSEEVSDLYVFTDHLKLFAASSLVGGMRKEDSSLVGANDGIVPLASALLSSAHVSADKINLTDSQGESLDHASYLDVASTMDYLAARLNTMVRVTISPSEAIAAGARWRLAGGAWQKSGVSLNALASGSYTIEFKDVPGWTRPTNKVVIVVQAATVDLNGSAATYTLEQPPTLSIVQLSSEAFQIGVTTAPGRDYWIQSSTDLVEWEMVYAATATTNSIQWTDTNAASRCYYRAVQLTPQSIRSSQ